MKKNNTMRHTIEKISRTMRHTKRRTGQQTINELNQDTNVNVAGSQHIQR